MKSVFKKGGSWEDDKGRSYTIKSVSNKDFNRYIQNGWFSQLDDCFALDGEFEQLPEKDSDYEAELREKIKSYGKKPGARSSIKTLEKQLRELEDDN